ncbi:hypothetical protein ACWGQ5_43420 [Streptomyces sp. NPDC055722]
MVAAACIRTSSRRTRRSRSGLGGVYGENCGISPLVVEEDETTWRVRGEWAGVLGYAVDPEAAARLRE